MLVVVVRWRVRRAALVELSSRRVNGRAHMHAWAGMDGWAEMDGWLDGWMDCLSDCLAVLLTDQC